MGQWWAENWFDVLQTVAISTGLFATVYNLRADRRERMVETQFALTAGHREIWSRLADKPALARVLKTRVDLQSKPITLEEDLLVRFVILHLRAAFKARRAGMDFGDDQVELDVRLLFTLPIPREIWHRYRQFQDAEFIAFVDECIAPQDSEAAE